MDTPPLPSLSELDDWLAERESRVPGLKPGVAAGVVWSDPVVRHPTPVALVYLHGYTATRGEIAPVADRIAAALGANLFYARLTGHGVGPDGHRTATAREWERDALEALAIGRLLGTRVVVLATSTGGTLATWLTLGPAAVRVDAMMLVSPNLTPRDRHSELLLWPGHEWLLEKIVGSTVTVAPQNELNERYWDLTHHSHSLIPMMQLVDKARTRDFRRWPTPVLVVYDLDDTVVDEHVTKRLFSKAPRHLATLHEWKTEPGDHNHVLAGDALSPQGTDKMVALGVEFLRGVLALP